MPTYVYRCPKCGAEVEIQQSVAASEHSPMCVSEGCDGQQSMNLQIQRTGFILKGDGWTSRGRA